MIVSLVFTLAIIAALASVAWRRWSKREARPDGPGATAESAIAVQSYAEIDRAVRGLRCRCGGVFRVRGESSPRSDGRLVRAVQLECPDCEHQRRIYFDVTLAGH